MSSSKRTKHSDTSDKAKVLRQRARRAAPEQEIEEKLDRRAARIANAIVAVIVVFILSCVITGLSDSWPIIYTVYLTDYYTSVVSYTVEGDGPATITYTDDGSPRDVHSWWFGLGPTDIKLPWTGYARGLPRRDSFVVEAVGLTTTTRLRCSIFNKKILQDPVVQEGVGRVRCEFHPIDISIPPKFPTPTVPISATQSLTQTLPFTQTLPTQTVTLMQPPLTQTASLTQTTPVTKTRVFMP